MNKVVLYKSNSAPPICEREILRYAGAKEPETAAYELLKVAVSEAENSIEYKICYCELPLKITENICEIGGIPFESRNLAEKLEGCETTIVFAATLGVNIDRLIMKYSRLSPAKALMIQAFGTERIEAMCDAFCKDIEAEKGRNLTARFSPGYGDLLLQYQREIFSLLDCEKRIGVTLNDSLLMSPTKSVTAICGVTKSTKLPKENKCSNCSKTDCIYRGIV